jgi:hypothetical protein
MSSRRQQPNHDAENPAPGNIIEIVEQPTARRMSQNNVIDIGDFITIEEESIRNEAERLGIHRRRPIPRSTERPETHPNDPASTLIDNVHVYDQARTINNLRSSMQSMPSTTQSHIFKAFETILDKKMPLTYHMIPKNMITGKDITTIDKKELINKFFISPVIKGSPIIIERDWEMAEMHDINDGHVRGPRDNGLDASFIFDITRPVTFYMQMTGFIVQENERTSFVAVDCLNFNGTSLIEKPYHYRLGRLHEICTLLVSDDVMIIPLQYFDVDKFITDRERDMKPFFIIDPAHVITGMTSLITVARFADEKKPQDPAEVIIDARHVIDVGSPESIVQLEMKGKEPDAAPATTGRESTPGGSPDATNTGNVLNTIATEMPVPGTTPRNGNESLANLRVYVTGIVSGLTKDQVKVIAESHGCTWHPRVNGQLDLLVIGHSNPGGQKIQDAGRLGIPTMPVRDFFRRISYRG